MVYGVRGRREDHYRPLDALDRGVYIISFHPETA